MGYKVEHTQLSGDQGADLIVERNGEKIVVQAKRSESTITNKAIQEVFTSINHYQAQRGMVVTNNEFTPSAVKLAESNQVELINRNSLTQLIDQYL